MAKTEKKQDNAKDAGKNKNIVPAIIGLAAIGGVLIGMNINSHSTSGASNVDDQIEAFIRANPKLILDVVVEYNTQQAQADLAQSINLVKANDGATILGNPDGDVTVYKFSDYNCGYCKRAYVNVQELIKSDPNLRVVIKEFPILSESSKIAAEISMAAAEMGRYEDIHTALMTWSGPLDDNAFNQILSDLDISREEIDTIIAKGDIAALLADTRSAAEALEISGTPGFVIGKNVVPGAIPTGQMAELVAQTRAENQ